MPLLGLADETCWFLKDQSMAILVLPCAHHRRSPFPGVVTVCGWRTWVYQPISMIDVQICFISSLCVEMMTVAPCWASSHSMRMTTLALS